MFTPKVVKHVTLPTLKLVEGTPVYVKILDPIFKGSSQPPKDPKETPKKPPLIFNVQNLVVNKAGDGLEYGDLMQMVAGKVVEREILDNYPSDKYVNKCFMIEKGKKKGTGDRGYFTYSIAEIVDPGPQKVSKKK